MGALASYLWPAQCDLKVTSWNIAAVNNNPWEYWITCDNPKYAKLMEDIENFVEDPKDKDIPVGDIFTNEMFERLMERMKQEEWQGLEIVRQYWSEDFKNRKIITEFLKDRTIGGKRLASMPDRVANTVFLAEPQGDFLCRPTIINVYDGDMSTPASWYDSWLTFVFDTSTNRREKDGTIQTKKICQLFMAISKAKYPAISEEEEAVSIPLQVLCLAIFDSILLHMMNTVSGSDWIDIKANLCAQLNKNKVQRTCQILENTYGDSDIIALQECGVVFMERIKSYGTMSKKFAVLAPENIDRNRDQNSIILLNKNRFDVESIQEVTPKVAEALTQREKKAPVAAGDLFALSVKELNSDRRLLIASFHGDTNGLATIPVTDSLYRVYDEHYKDHALVFCLDANTYEKGVPDKFQGVTEYAECFVGFGLTSCFGDHPDPTNYTTFNARTYLQPQLNKACKSTEKKQKGDINPKDLILCSKQHFTPQSWCKDNTGNKTYTEDMVFPTLTFPSDHGVLSVELMNVTN